jgi:hypothetical protein
LRPAHFTQPLWLGESPLAGKSILLHCEQGLGDAIQFFRYAALVRALGAQVSVEAPAALFELFKAAANDVEVIRTGSDLSGFDYHCPLLSLPLALKTTLATIPHQQSYLRSDPAKVALWSKRLGPARRPRIGLVWRGNASHNHDHFRSVPLAALLPYLPEGVDYVSLQKELRDGDQEALNANPELTYALVDTPKGYLLMAQSLVDKCLERYQLTGQVIATTIGKNLDGLVFKHPLHDVDAGYRRLSPIFLADYVSAEDGTGLVHSSPAYGVDDFNSCVANGISYDQILNPVLGNGQYNASAGGTI